MRRSQILLASSRGERAPKIALNLGCASQTVRDAIHDFNGRGPGRPRCGNPRAPRKPVMHSTGGAEALREMLHRSPREFGYESSLGPWRWPHMPPSSGVSPRAGLGGDHPGYLVASAGGEVDASQAVDNLPRPPIRTKKRRRDRLMEVAASNPEWAVGFEDECWWSRVALPTLERLGRGRRSRFASSSVRSPRKTPSRRP